MGIGTHTKPNRGGTDVWLTPPHIIEALGGWESFDLDPCGAMVDGKTWQTALTVYTERGDSLPWFGRVWLNPPYSDVEWWLKQLAQLGSGTALVFARTETRWFFSEIWRKASAVLFIEGRLHFHHSDGRRAKANAGGPSVLVAYGADDRNRLQVAAASEKLPGHFSDISHTDPEISGGRCIH